MSYETCYACDKSGETDNDDGGSFERGLFGERYLCAKCRQKEIAAEDPPGDSWEEQKIKDKEDDRQR